MKQHTIIVHGWSDDRKSFENLATYVRSLPERQVDTIYLADWISLNDDVTYRDLTFAMQRAWLAKQLPTTPRSVDVIGHSTAALVVRDWMTTYYTAQTCPIHRHVMLAPANFGSPLAHKGRAWTGRLAKGFKSKFETGTQLLKGLELASPYVWQLAEKDLLTRGVKRWYGQDRILCTCLIGNAPYDGFPGAISEDGSDGTIRIAGANPNVSRLNVIYDEPNGQPQPPALKLIHPPKHFVAFTSIDGENHSTITMNRKTYPRNDHTLALIAEALSQTDSTWANWCQNLEHDHRDTWEHQAKHADGDEHYNHYQDSIVRVRDQFDQPVDDYLLEFKINDRDRGGFARRFHRHAIRKVHVHSDDPSHRSIYVDVTTLFDDIDKRGEGLKIELTASPIMTKGRGAPPVGYRPPTAHQDDALFIPWEQLASVFAADRTMLIDIQLHRVITPEVFELVSHV